MSENEREVKKDYEEMRGRIQQGEPLYGRSRLSEYAQGVAMRNSTWSQLHSGQPPLLCLLAGSLGRVRTMETNQ